MIKHVYAFPATKWANGGTSLQNQCRRIIDEACEVDIAERAFSCGVNASVVDVAMATLDVIQACETMLRILEEYYGVDIDAAVKAVYSKNAARGCY